MTTATINPAMALLVGMGNLTLSLPTTPEATATQPKTTPVAVVATTAAATTLVAVATVLTPATTPVEEDLA